MPLFDETLKFVVTTLFCSQRLLRNSFIFSVFSLFPVWNFPFTKSLTLFFLFFFFFFLLSAFIVTKEKGTTFFYLFGMVNIGYPLRLILTKTYGIVIFFPSVFLLSSSSAFVFGLNQASIICKLYSFSWRIECHLSLAVILVLSQKWSD